MNMKEKEIQRKYLQLQLSKEQLSSLLNERASLEEKIMELSSTVQSLEQIAKVRQGEEIWAPVGSGSFIEANIKNVSEIAIGVGAGIVVKKKIADASEILNSRLSVLADLNNRFTMEINKIAKHVEKAEQDLEYMVNAEQKEGVGG